MRRKCLGNLEETRSCWEEEERNLITLNAKCSQRVGKRRIVGSRTPRRNGSHPHISLFQTLSQHVKHISRRPKFQRQNQEFMVPSIAKQDILRPSKPLSMQQRTSTNIPTTIIKPISSLLPKVVVIHHPMQLSSIVGRCRGGKKSRCGCAREELFRYRCGSCANVSSLRCICYASQLAATVFDARADCV